MQEENSSQLLREGESAVDIIVFETERLIVREFNLDDVDAVLEYSADSDSMIYVDGNPETSDEVTNYIHLRLVQQIVPQRTIYDFALANDFRFLSYGDSSLLQKV